MMRTIEYCKEGEAIADHNCEERAKVFLDSDSNLSELKVSTENFIIIVRARIAEGLADYRNVRFLYDGEYLYPNTNGSLAVSPGGFCKHTDNAYMRCISACLKKD